MTKLSLTFLLSSLLATTLTAQSVQTTMEAVQPLTLSLGSVVQQQHPAGPFTTASLSINDPSCLATGSLSCTLNGNHVTAAQNVWGPNCGGLTANTDVRLTLTSPQSGWATLRFYIGAGGDCGGSFRVDVDDDGSNEIYYTWGTTFEKSRNLIVPVGPTAQVVRITQYTCGAQPTAQSFNLTIDEWDPTATPDQPGCGGLFGSPGWQALECDHTLMFLDSLVPSELGVLRAGGYGQFHTFVVATSSTTLPLQLPTPFAQTCPTLANVLAFDSGLHSGMLGRQDIWNLHVPMLPIGLTFYVQHACAAIYQPSQFWAQTRFDTSNVLRIDT